MNAILRAAAVLAAVAGLAAPSLAESLDGAVFGVTLETGGLGPVEIHLALEERDGTVRACLSPSSPSGSAGSSPS